MEVESGSERFCVPKTSFQENVLVNDAVPASTKYKNKWAVSSFAEWQRLREVQVPVLDCGSLFKDYDWLSKFVVEVAKKSGGRYPLKTVYGIICALKGYLAEKNGSEALNPLDASDKRKLTTFRPHCSEF